MVIKREARANLFVGTQIETEGLGAMKELRCYNMAADSTRAATYLIRLLALSEGYAVEKQWGSGKRVAGREIYWRPSEEEAQALYDSILIKKTAPERTRVYRIAVAEGEQLDLFGV